MRTAEIEINGEKHLLCYNLWALCECVERYGSVSNIADGINGENEGKNIAETVWLLSVLMRGGELYAREMNIENAKPLTIDRLKILCGAGSILDLKAHVIQAITAGMTSHLEVDGSKNSETTQA